MSEEKKTNAPSFNVSCQECGETDNIQFSTDLITKDLNIKCLECKNEVQLFNPNFDHDSTDINIYNVPLHGVVPLDKETYMLRVPGGWIYIFDVKEKMNTSKKKESVFKSTSETQRQVFVPFSDEFLVASYSI